MPLINGTTSTDVPLINGTSVDDVPLINGTSVDNVPLINGTSSKSCTITLMGHQIALIIQGGGFLVAAASSGRS